MKQKLFAILLSMIMLFITPIYAKGDEKQSIPGRAIFVMAPDYPVQVLSKQLGCQNNKVRVNIKVPQIKGLEDEKFEKELNYCLLKDATMRKKQLVQEATNNSKQSKVLGLEPKAYELIRSYTIKQSKEPYMVIGIFEYSYTGGAHGLSCQKYIVINKETNQIVNLKDLFNKDDYKKIIKEEIIAQIPQKKVEGILFFDDVNTTIEITDQQDFYIDSKGNIVIVFNVYEIAPYVSGIIEFTIPRENLKNILIED